MWDKLRACPASSSVRPHEIDEACLDIHIDQLHAHSLADVETVESMHDLSFDWRMEDARPRSFGSGAGADAVEALADAVAQQTRRGWFPHLPLDLVRGVFLLRAVISE